jgi:hypothetical protein
MTTRSKGIGKKSRRATLNSEGSGARKDEERSFVAALLRMTTKGKGDGKATATANR